MGVTHFKQLNNGWNAEPNAPEPAVRVQGREIILSFRMNPFKYPAFQEDDVGELHFSGCARYRLGPTNDEGWYRGQCRFSDVAPQWGEFYEVIGDLRDNDAPPGRIDLEPIQAGSRHFLFYLRDHTFECDAAEWSLQFRKDTTNFAALL